uniref:Putative group II intron reverse transcriptase/maturase protein n=1 Tax=Gracilaria firma TaxID=2510791 RepID=A0A1P8D6H8_9FLOR|nr:putative group II intron reverse transcriptase/maturase protein [Gracilaria firma]APR74413.1 putative group II intron reverse transcriptase/maturase protein [Gracilaria firma]
MTSYILDEQTKWKYLPWNQINHRVAILKYKIYKASKMCDKNLIYETQNNLLNSNEAKIIAIQNVCRSINNSYINWHKENYRILDIHKTKIFSFLFEHCKPDSICESFQSIITKIEQYIIYLCLESEWNVRFKSNFDTSIYNNLSSKLAEKNPIFFYCNYSINNTYLSNFKYYIPSQYINIKYIQKKMQTFSYFFCNIMKWLRVQNFNEQCIVSNYSSFLQPGELVLYKYRIYILICNIYLHGIEWFNFKLISIEKKINHVRKEEILGNYMSFKYGLYNSTNLYYINFIENLYTISKSLNSHISVYININKNKKYINNKSHNCYWMIKETCKLLFYDIYWKLELNQNVYNQLIHYCRNLLYTKNILKSLRINKHIYLKELIYKLFKLLTTFFESYSILITFVIIKKLYKLFSDILYFWYKKKYKKILKFKLHQLHNYWNNRLFITFIVSIRSELLYMIFLKQINR